MELILSRVNTVKQNFQSEISSIPFHENEVHLAWCYIYFPGPSGNTSILEYIYITPTQPNPTLCKDYLSLDSFYSQLTRLDYTNPNNEQQTTSFRFTTPSLFPLNPRKQTTPQTRSLPLGHPDLPQETQGIRQSFIRRKRRHHSASDTKSRSKP